jgi:hypothetical protein
MVLSDFISEDKAWSEMEARQRSLNTARRYCYEATDAVFVIADADEYPVGITPEEMRAEFAALQPGEALALPMLSPYDGMSRVRTDGSFSGAKVTVAFRDRPGVGWAAASDGYRFHSRCPRSVVQNRIGPGNLVHLQFASRRRLAAKAAWYKVVERLAHGTRDTAAALNKKYDWTLVEEGATFIETPPGVFDDTIGLDLAAEPWQLVELRKLLPTVPARLLVGLDLHESILGPHA